MLFYGIHIKCAWIRIYDVVVNVEQNYTVSCFFLLFLEEIARTSLLLRLLIRNEVSAIIKSIDLIHWLDWCCFCLFLFYFSFLTQLNTILVRFSFISLALYKIITFHINRIQFWMFLFFVCTVCAGAHIKGILRGNKIVDNVRIQMI